MKITTRTKQLARIHAQARDLHLTDTSYRRLLLALTGKRSSGTMTDEERQKVIDFFDNEIRDAREQAWPRFDPQPEIVTDAEALDILGGY